MGHCPKATNNQLTPNSKTSSKDPTANNHHLTKGHDTPIGQPINQPIDPQSTDHLIGQPKTNI
jgi:hypothetical protein